MSRFNEEATINVESITSPEYISTLTLLKNNDIDSHRELYKRISIPLFCLVSLIFSLIFSSYAAFLAEKGLIFF